MSGSGCCHPQRAQILRVPDRSVAGHPKVAMHVVEPEACCKPSGLRVCGVAPYQGIAPEAGHKPLFSGLGCVVVHCRGDQRLERLLQVLQRARCHVAESLQAAISGSGTRRGGMIMWVEGLTCCAENCHQQKARRTSSSPGHAMPSTLETDAATRCGFLRHALADAVRMLRALCSECTRIEVSCTAHDHVQ